MYGKIILSICLSLWITVSSAQVRECAIIHKLITGMQSGHVTGATLDAKASERVFMRLIDAVDPYRILFTRADLQAYDAVKTHLLDPGSRVPCDFLPSFVKLTRLKLHSYDSLLHLQEGHAMDIRSDEHLTTPEVSMEAFPVGEKERADRIRQWIRYRALIYFYQSDTLHKPINTLQAVWIDKAVQAELCRVRDKVDQGDEFSHGLRELFLNCITAAFDPHSNYFSEDSRNRFQEYLSTEAYAFGFELDEGENSEWTINGLVPGSPAWRCNELNKGDVVVGVGWQGETPFDLTCMSLERLHEALAVGKSRIIELKVRKKDGQVRPVVLKSEKLANEENRIRGYVLEGERKVGYIYLPDFYTSWEQEKALGCSNDVAREILKLKKENIEGLILDLRYNGGGSVYEAIDLAGIFIDEGPMTTSFEKGDKPRLLKDFNRGTIYDGPLIVMVNNSSASASEIVSGALQDYNRGLIVGSPTFGKASGQQIVPLEVLGIPPEERMNIEGKDFVKITDTRYFRTDGSSHQRTGIQPDVLLPEAFSAYATREEDEENALTNTSIDKKPEIRKLPAFPVKELAAKSAARLDTIHAFDEIINVNETLKALMDDDNDIPLRYESFMKRAGEQKELLERISNAMTQKAMAYEVKSNQYGLELAEADAFEKEMDARLRQSIEEDIYIEEVYYIMKDLLAH